jgi:hypothetical protein
MSTVTISKPFYRHSAVADNESQNNRVRFFTMLRASLGDDYTQWLKHPMYSSVEHLAHVTIYGRTDEYRAKKGLELQVCYLQQARNQLSNRRQTMLYCYEQAVASAIDAGVISADDALKWRMGITQ